MPMCYSHYHLNLPKPIRSWFPGRLVPPFVVTTGRTESLPGRVEHAVCGSLGSCGPRPGSVVRHGPFPDPALYDSPRACCGLQVVKLPFQPQGHLVPASTDSCPPALPAPWSCTSLGDKSQYKARSQPLSQKLAEGSG